jgi:hypothetical protein
MRKIVNKTNLTKRFMPPSNPTALSLEPKQAAGCRERGGSRPCRRGDATRRAGAGRGREALASRLEVARSIGGRRGRAIDQSECLQQWQV